MRKIHPSTIVKVLKGLDDNSKSMTVKELLKLNEDKVQIKNGETDLINNDIIKEFSNTFLKIVKDDMFGPETIYYHITNLKAGSLTTEWSQLFELSGTLVSFSETNIATRKIGEYREESMDIEELRTAEKISEEVFLDAMNQYETIQFILKKVK